MTAIIVGGRYNMALDSLQKSVLDFSTKKTVFVNERQFFEAEHHKVDLLSAVSAHLDDTIVGAVDGIRQEFSLEQVELERRADAILDERDALAKSIRDEQAKLDTVQQKIDGLTGGKYTDGFEAVLQECDALLEKLDEMLKDLDDGDSAGTVGSALDRSGSDRTDKDETSAPKAKDGFWSALFSKKQAVPSGPKFGSFDLAPTRNGSDFFVKGTNYAQFINDYYHSGQSTYEDLGNRAVITTISPGNIEGIHLGKTEAADSSIFWSQHESGGTRESFVEIASHIPEVNYLRKAGMSLDEIRKTPSLERCVDIYFEPSNIPRVIQSNGYYEFDSNGRHRILAAREAGYDIPVRIVGIRKWK